MSTTARRQFHEAPRDSRGRARSRAGALCVSFALVATLAWAGAAGAQLPFTGAGAQFDITGFIQTATLDAPGDVLAGGTVVVNGHTIIVPRNTIFQMPANALTWQQLFAQAPAPYTGVATGMALFDVPTPLGTFEVHVQGNIVNNTYLAGLIFLSQHSLMSGQGFINFMDYANHEMRVGGVIGDPSTGTRVKINDPIARFAPAYTVDPRFTIDTENPTIRTETGFPLCFPHVNPATANDPLCPQQNRPINPGTGFPLSIFTMQAGGNAPGPAVGTNPWVAAPFEVGDYVTYSGNLMKDGPQPSAGPYPLAGASATYIAAHTVIGNVGIFTASGTNPSYIATDVMLLGVGGLPIAGLAQEVTIRTRFEGFASDATPGRNVSLWGMDVDACSAATSDRGWGTTDIDLGPPAGAVKGRWRYRPAQAGNKLLTGPLAGTYLPATRMMRSILDGAYTAAAPIMSNNGLITGQYAAPIFEFLFPENLGIGSPPVPLNFQDFPFLVNGTFAALPGVNVGQLLPFPTAVVPASKCGPPPPAAPPTANAGAAQTVTAGSVVTLDGSLSSDPNGLAIAWVWTPAAGTTLNSTTVTKPTFTATATGTFTFSLVVTNTVALSSPAATVTITVKPAGAAAAPTANAGAAQNVAAGAVVQLNGTASTDPNVPAQTLTYAWTQTAGAPVATLSSATAATPTFTATPTLALHTLTFSLKVTNTSLLPSTNVTTVVITVRAAVAPTANAGTTQSVLISKKVQLDGSVSFDPNGLPLTYLWSPGGVALSPGNTAVKPTFTAPNKATTVSPTLQVTNTLGQKSTTAKVSINVVSTPDTVAITVVIYRISKQRCDVTATSSIADGSPVLSLVGFGANGTDLQMAYAGAGTYTIIVQGIAEPLSVTVTSSAGGSASSPVLTRIN